MHPHEPTDFHKPFLTSLVVIALVVFGYGAFGAVKVNTQNSAATIQSDATKISTPDAVQGPINPPPITSTGYVYVTDVNNNRIQKFDSNGNFILQWGSFGTGIGQFDHPLGVAVDLYGNVYVADAYNHRIQKFDSGGDPILRWGGHGTANGKFDSPHDVAVDPLGNVYVADRLNNRIQKFTSNGSFLLKFGSYGTGNGQFKGPFGVGVRASNGEVYVVDQDNHRIQRFTSTGQYLSKWGSVGTGNGYFWSPDRVVIDRANTVYVSDDTNNNRIQKFDAMGGFLTKWGTYGTGNGQFNNPSGVAIDPIGNIYVVDDWNYRIQKFSPTGAYLSQWGSQGSGAGQFDLPVGIAITNGLPDLQITNVTPDPTTLTRNLIYPYIAMDFTVKNVGLVPLTIPVTTKFSLYGVNGIYGGMLVGQFLPGSPITLLPNQTYTFHNVNTSSTPNLRANLGYFNFKLIADESNVIDESFETNNTFGFGLTIVP